jgi:uncharacterized metal-binding protein YceD (DUF177 family)
MEKINIANLSEGQHIFEFMPESEELEIDQPKIEELKLNVILSKTGTQLILDAEITGRFCLSCDRCIEMYDQPFEQKFEIVYKYDFTGEQENTDDNIKFISPKTIFIDISNEVRDYILLSVPMKAVPPENKGKCSFCGKDIEKLLNPERKEDINPVWEKLIKLKTKE